MRDRLTPVEQAEVVRLMPLAIDVARGAKLRDPDEAESVALEALVDAVLRWRALEQTNLDGFVRTCVRDKLRDFARAEIRRLRDRVEGFDLSLVEAPEQIREVFPTKKVTQEDAAKKIGRSSRTLRRWKNAAK